jgi:hypothetical protein
VTTSRCAIVLLSCAILFSAGCGVHRGNMTALSQEQQQYFAKLEDTLRQKRPTLAIALEEQLKVDRTRQQNLLDWQRDLEKADVLLARQPDVTGADRLLHMKLAELDLESVERIAELQQIDESRKNAILKLYDRLTAALKTLQQNSDTLLKYLESKDAVFALKSFDVEGMFRVMTNIREGSEELGYLKKASTEEIRARKAYAEQAIERTRSLLINIFRK